MEDKIQSKFHEQLRNKYPRTVSLCNHVPNGGLRNQIEASKLKAMGVVRGWPDYQIMIPAGAYHGLYIEFKDLGMKTTDKLKRGNKLTEHEERQHKVQGRLRSAGYRVEECDQWEEAMAVFEDYAKGTHYLEINPNYIT